MSDILMPRYLFMRPNSWSSNWMMPNIILGVSSSAVPGNSESSHEQTLGADGAATPLSNATLEPSTPSWPRSAMPPLSSGGILGALPRPNGLLNLSPIPWSRSTAPFGATAGILAPLASAASSTPESASQAGDDSADRQRPFDPNVRFFNPSAEPSGQTSSDSSSETMEDSSVEPPPAHSIPIFGAQDLRPGTASKSAAPAQAQDFRTRLLEALSDKNLRYYAGPGFSEFIDKLAGLVPILPGSGTVQSMQESAEAGKHFERGNYGSAAAHLGTGTANLALDWLPMEKPLAILGGMAAKTFPWAKLKIAEAMEKAGKSTDEIWRATGLERGADNRWRFEISDRGYRVKPNIGVLDAHGYRVAPLYEQQVHPGMQAAYPSLAEAQSMIKIDRRMPSEGRGVFTTGDPSVPKVIEITVPSRSHVRTESIHELQHMIDDLEGHARGGSMFEFMGPGVSRQQAWDMYQRLAGEVAARNAQYRLYENELLRLRRSPLWTEKKLEYPVPRDQQIIKFFKKNE